MGIAVSSYRHNAPGLFSKNCCLGAVSGRLDLSYEDLLCQSRSSRHLRRNDTLLGNWLRCGVKDKAFGPKNSSIYWSGQRLDAA